jgi:hypothetical protein
VISVSKKGSKGQILIQAEGEFALEMDAIDGYDLQIVKRLFKPYDKVNWTPDMFSGFEKIIEQRIKDAQKKGEFDNLPGSGKPLDLTEDANVPEELRMAHKLLKNADYLPPEIEIKKDIKQTEELLAGMKDTADKYHIMKKLNFLIMKLNSVRNGSVEFDVPQQYSTKLVDHMESRRPEKKRR